MKPWLKWVLGIGLFVLLIILVMYVVNLRKAPASSNTTPTPGNTKPVDAVTLKPSTDQNNQVTQAAQKNTNGVIVGYTSLVPVKPMLEENTCRNLCISMVGYGAERLDSPRRPDWERCEKEVCGWRRDWHFCNGQFEDLNWSLKS